MRKLILAGLVVAGVCSLVVGGCSVEEPPAPAPAPQPARPDAGQPPPSCPGTSLLSPVCGINFQSYRNELAAACAHTDTLHKGYCLPEEGAACTPDGGPLSDGGSGACTWRTYCSPQRDSRCVQTYRTCGKDFRSYPSYEAARQAGIAELHEGACLPGEGAACTPGAPSSGCGTELWCDPTLSRCVRPSDVCAAPLGSIGGFLDYTSQEHAALEGYTVVHHGSCLREESSSSCTPGNAGSGCPPGLECSALYRRCVNIRFVCGTDFQTYSPPEAAAAAGVAVLHPGMCTLREGQPCSNPDAPYDFFGGECGRGIFCERSRLVCSHAQPICGEDFKTYGFPSDAAHAGVAPLHEGACLQGEGAACALGPDGGPSCRPGLVCHPQRERCVKP